MWTAAAAGVETTVARGLGVEPRVATASSET